MKSSGLIVLGVVTLYGVSLMATLPPDAELQQQQILQYRQRAMAEYEKQQKALGQERIDSRVRVLATMERSPWSSAAKPAAAPNPVSSSAEPEKRIEIKSHRFLVSFVLITLLVAIAGWVRYATRELDE